MSFAALCLEHGTTPIEVRSRSRTDEAVRTRRAVCMALYAQLGPQWSAIGRIVNKHHSTVMNLCRALGKAVRVEPVRLSRWRRAHRIRQLVADGAGL